MKKSIKKLFAMLLALAVVFSLAACIKAPVEQTDPPETKTQQPTGGKETTPPTTEKLYYNETGYPICDEPITIRVSGKMGYTADWQNTTFVKYVEEHLGIKLICEPVADDAIANQYAKWLSDPATMPDLIIWGGFKRVQVDADGKDGFFLDIAQYKDLMPNMYAFFEQYPELEDMVTTKDGNIYSLTRITTPVSSKVSNWMTIYHIPTLEAAGVNAEEIKTTEDLYQALKKLKEAYPDKTPYLMSPDKETGYRMDVNLRTAFGVYSNDNSYMVSDANGEVELLDISDNQREYLKFVNKLVAEGLVDVSDFGKSADELNAGIKEGKYCFWTGSVNPITDEEKDLQAAGDGSWYKNYGMIWGLTTDGLTDKASFIQNNGVLNSAGTLINAQTEYPEAICRFIDWAFSEEGQIICSEGQEGVNFEFLENPETGVKYVSYDKFYDKSYENGWAWNINKNVIYQAMAYNWGFLGVLDSLTDEQLAKIPENSTQIWTARRILGAKEVENWIVADVPVLYTAEQNDAMGTLKADLTTFLKTAKAEFMAGTRDPNSDADWAAFVKQVKDMGWEDTMKAIEQDARG